MEIHTLYPEDFEQFLSEHKETDYQIVDVRQPQEYETGHIPGAKLLPLSELEGRLDELAEDRDLIFYWPLKPPWSNSQRWKPPMPGLFTDF